MKSIEQQLKNLPRSSGIGPLLQPTPQREKRSLHGSPKRSDLLADPKERGAHADNSLIDIDELSAQAHEISVVSIDEINELAVEGGEV